MRKYGAHAATDVTGFGLIGHARNLAEHQTAKVELQVHKLPCIANTVEVQQPYGRNFNLTEGKSPETSGQCVINRFVTH